MLSRLNRARLIIPTLMTLIMLPVLLWLGAWQLERKVWKEDLIARLAAGRTSEPVPLKEVWDRYARGENIEYTRVRVTGTFDHKTERHVYDPRPDAQGWDVYTVLRTDDGLVYVNRGWILDKLKDPAARGEGQVSDAVTITGLARLPETKGVFTPAGDAKGNRWYHRDPTAFQQNGASSLATAPRFLVYPFSIDAEPDTVTPGGWPKAFPTEIRLANRHLEYVLTWWGLAVTLLIVYGLFVRKRLRETPA